MKKPTFSQEDQQIEQLQTVETDGLAQPEGSKDSDIVVSDEVLDALREKFLVDASTLPYTKLEDFDLDSLKGLTLNQALLRYPKLLKIMDDVLTNVASIISSLDTESKQVGSQKEDLEQQALSSAFKMKKIGKWLHANGHFEKALVALQQAMYVLSEDGEIYMMIADIHFLQEDYTRAFEYYKASMLFLPEERKKRVRRRLADLHVKMAESFLGEDKDTARHFYDAAKTYIKDYHPALYGLGFIAFVSGDLDSAEMYFTQALDAEPNSVKYRIALGNLMMEKGDDELAEEFYDEAIAVDPQSVEALYEMANLQFHVRDNFARAAKYLRAAWREEPTNIRVLLLKIELAFAMDDYDSAEQDIERVLALEPNNREAFDFYCRLKNGEFFWSRSVNSPLPRVLPERRETSRDYYFSLSYRTYPDSEALEHYADEVAEDQDDKFNYHPVSYYKKILN